MVIITASTQLSTFSMIRNILLSNSVLGAKFRTKDFYEFEPRHKSTSFNGFPYIIIMVPTAEDEQAYLGDTISDKEFEVEIILRMDFLAKDNFTSYASSILNELDNSQSDFQASGYYMHSIEFEGSQSIVEDQKHLVEGTFSLILKGEVD